MAPAPHRSHGVRLRTLTQPRARIPGCPIHAVFSHEWDIAQSAIRSCSWSLSSPLKTIISTEAAHAPVSRAVENRGPRQLCWWGERYPLLYGYRPPTPTLLPLSVLPPHPQRNRHFDRSCSRFCEQRSGEIRFSTQNLPARQAEATNPREPSSSSPNLSPHPILKQACSPLAPYPAAAPRASLYR